MKKRYINKVTTKGQVVIPKELRDKYGITPSTNLVFEEGRDYIVMKRSPAVEEMYGFIKARKPATDKDIKNAIDKGMHDEYLKKLNKPK